MPVILREKGYKLFFYSNEGIPREHAHIHIRKAEAVAKVWIEPDVQLESAFGFSSSELSEIAELVLVHREQLLRSWYEYFGE